MSSDKTSHSDFPAKETVEQVEHVQPPDYGKNDQSELNGIESTAASKAAWLISIVVSIGGLLFGMYFTPRCETILTHPDPRVMTRAISLRF